MLVERALVYNTMKCQMIEITTLPNIVCCKSRKCGNENNINYVVLVILFSASRTHNF